jgi:23S rRNA pseudouridine1911/1915/1917 synthase
LTRQGRFRIERPSQLLKALLEAPLGLSRTEAKRLLRFRAISVNGRSPVRHDTLVAPGDIVTISASRNPSSPEVGGSFPKIVYEDDVIVVVDKPAGLLTIATETEKTRTAYRALNEHLKARARTSNQQIFVVHRLDRDTSGLLVFARTEAMKLALQNGWKSVRKTYQAVVEGVPASPVGTLRGRLVETSSLLVHQSDRRGRIAVTRYRVLRAGLECSLLELEIETGRKNQIRVQLAEIGHPIVGDRKYGARSNPAGRLALHACELGFVHPFSGEPMRLRSALPASFRRLLR